MGPRGRADELPQERRAPLGPGFATGGVLEVGDLSSHRVEKLIVEGELPELLARERGGLEQPVQERLVVAHESRRVIAQRDDAGACERGEIDDLVYLSAGGEGERVGEQEPALRIGVRDFHRLAAEPAYDVARPHRVPAGHVLGGRSDAEDAHGDLQVAERTHHRHDHRCPGHVAFHPRHAARGLDVEAAAVERNALADERDGPRGSCAAGRVLSLGPVLEHDEPGRLCTPGRDRGKEAHPRRARVIEIHHRDVEMGAGGDLRCGVRECGRRQDVGGFVNKIPGAAGRLDGHLRRAHRPVERRQTAVASKQDDVRDLRCVAGLPVAVKPVVTEPGALDDGAHALLRQHVRRRSTRPRGKRNARRTHLPGPPERDGGIAAERLGSGVPSHPDEQHAAKRRVGSVEQNRTAALSREVVIPGHLCQAPSHGPINFGCVSLERPRLRDGNREQIARGLRGRGVGKNKTHGVLRVTTGRAGRPARA